MAVKYYFYNGFGKPEEIDIRDVIVESNYRGNITDEMTEEHEEWKSESDEEYNEHMGFYGIYRNPTIEEFRIVNEMFGLDEDTYLDEWL